MVQTKDFEADCRVSCALDGHTSLLLICTGVREARITCGFGRDNSRLADQRVRQGGFPMVHVPWFGSKKHKVPNLMNKVGHSYCLSPTRPVVVSDSTTAYPLTFGTSKNVSKTF